MLRSMGGKRMSACESGEYATIRPAICPDLPPMPLRALLYRRPTEPQAIEVVCDGAIHLVRLRRHRRRRRASGCREAREFAEKHGAWIAARLGRLPKAAPFAHGTEFPLRGIVHVIVHRRGVRGTVWTESDRHGGHLLCVAGASEHIQRRITDHL